LLEKLPLAEYRLRSYKASEQTKNRMLCIVREETSQIVMVFTSQGK
jgi:hypothetical protein